MLRSRRSLLEFELRLLRLADRPSGIGLNMIDVALLLIVAGVTWCVASEGAWGAMTMLVIVILSGLLAMNFFEPLANLLQEMILGSGSWPVYWDFISLTGLFALFVFGMRYAIERWCTSPIELPMPLSEIGRWGCGLATGYVTMAFLLTALHTAPLPREFIDFKPERNNLFNIDAPDRRWLGFTQYVSEKSLRRGASGHIFDGPRFKAGGVSNEVWPSFPLRYAARREQFSGVSIAADAGEKPRTIRRRPQSGGSGPSF